MSEGTMIEIWNWLAAPVPLNADCPKFAAIGIAVGLILIGMGST